MTNGLLMPLATAVWLVENTTLTFKQIANFCNLHEVEIQGIADGEVAKGIKPYNPIISGQLSREEIELSTKDESRPLNIKSNDIEISGEEKKIKKYVPMSKRQDKPDSALWLIKHHPQLKDSQIAKLIGITKNSATSSFEIFHSGSSSTKATKVCTIYPDMGIGMGVNSPIICTFFGSIPISSLASLNAVSSRFSFSSFEPPGSAICPG